LYSNYPALQLGGLFIWTYTYSLMQKSGKLYHKMQSKSIQCPADRDEEHLEQFKAHDESARDDEEAALPASAGPNGHDVGNQLVSSELSLLVLVLACSEFRGADWGRNAGGSASVVRERRHRQGLLDEAQGGRAPARRGAHGAADYICGTCLPNNSPFELNIDVLKLSGPFSY
jgi:hypothetical protein